MRELNRHIFFISSWYPGNSRSSGTFIETQIKALQELGVKCAIMFTAEFTAGNYIRTKIADKPIFDIRRKPDIRMVWNLVVHLLPLRLFQDVSAARRKKIEHNAIRSFGKYIQAHGKPDFIFHHGLFDYTYLTEAISAHFKIPYYFMEHSAFVKEGEINTANGFTSAIDLQRFVAGAEKRFAVAQVYADKFARIFGVEFHYCPNVLSTDFFLDSNTEQRPQKSDLFTFVNVGILEPHKNQELLIRAFAQAFHGRKDVVLKIAGDGRLGAFLNALAKELNAANQVEILGFLKPEDVRKLLDESHAFVLSSTFETFGVVLIEAMARGLPVISSDIPGPSELINSENGMLFKSGSVDDLALKLKEMHAHYKRYDGSRIVQKTNYRFGPEAFGGFLFGED